jgi:hypothetical protein
MRVGDLVLLHQGDIYRRGKTEPLSIPVWKYKANGTPTPYSQVLEGQLATVMDWQPAGTPFPNKSGSVRQTGAVEVLLADGERWWLLEPRCVSVQEVSDG